MTSSPLPFLAGGGKQRHLQSQENATNSRFYFIFLDLSGSNAFSLFCLFSFIRWQIWWLGELLLLLIRFRWR
jgi:hypothetical protein